MSDQVNRPVEEPKRRGRKRENIGPARNCKHPDIAYCYYNKKTKENVYQCTECGRFFYQ